MADWVDATTDDIPPNAWPAGEDKDGTPFFVVRGNDKTDITTYRQVGKVQKGSDGAYMANWTKVCKAKKFQVLTLPAEGITTLKWITIDHKTCAPPNSFIVMPDHQMCVARAEFENEWYAGIVNVDNNICYVCVSNGNDTKLTKLDTWQVLIEEPINGPVWVETTGNTIPEHAWKAGYEADGKSLYLAYNTSLGKLGSHMDGACVAHNGYLLEFHYSWVMTLPPTADVSLKWVVLDKKQTIPSNAYRITTMAYLGPTAVRVARAEHKKGMQPGIYIVDNDVCYVPVKKNDKGKVLKKSSFEVLVTELPH